MYSVLKLSANRSDCISKPLFLDNGGDDNKKTQTQYIPGKVACYSIQARMNGTFYVRTNNKWPSSSTTVQKNIAILATGTNANTILYLISSFNEWSLRLHFRPFRVRNILLSYLFMWMCVCPYSLSYIGTLPGALLLF